MEAHIELRRSNWVDERQKGLEDFYFSNDVFVWFRLLQLCILTTIPSFDKKQELHYLISKFIQVFVLELYFN